MEVLVYLALGVLVAPYILMAAASIKMYLEYIRGQDKTHLDLTKSA